MDNKIENIIKEINREYGTNFNPKDMKPLLKITLKKMLSGKGFDESFKEAIETVLSMQQRFAANTNRGKLAREILFKQMMVEVNKNG